MARISTKYLLDGGERVTPPTTAKTTATTTTATTVRPAAPFVDPQDVRDPATGFTPAQMAAQKALAEAVAAGKELGIETKPNVVTPGNVPTVSITKMPQRFTQTPAPVLTFTPTPASTSSTTASTTETPGLTTNVDVLKSLLRGMGFTSSLIDSSADFLNRLLKDGLSYDNAIAIFLDSKEYTFKDGKKTTSPFYTAYGYLNEGLVVPKSAAELYNAVEGYKGVVSKYNLNEKYISQDSLKKYVKNNVSVSELDERANAARLKAVNADPYYVQALMKLGYVKEATDLTDFFLNPEIGKEALEQNRSTAAFSTEAIRRSQQGLAFSGERFKQLTAGLLGQGLSEQQIGAMAATGFESIAQSLRPTQKLAGIYEGAPQGGEVDQIQKELEAEQFLGTASQRRKRLAEMELAAFQRSAGTTTVSQRRPTAGIIQNPDTDQPAPCGV